MNEQEGYVELVIEGGENVPRPWLITALLRAVG